MDANPWIRTYTGKKFYPLQPRPEAIDVEHIATALSRIPRFCGATSRFYSVAEHSMWVCGLMQCQSAAGYVRHLELLLPALFHDAHEAYSGFADVQKPMKALFPAVKHIERRIDAAIAERFGFLVSGLDAVEIKDADGHMCEIEADVLCRHSGRLRYHLDTWCMPSCFAATDYSLSEPARAAEAFLRTFGAIT